MKALTIWQPWASLIIAGAKPYEFRGWRAPRSLIGQRIVIHAAAKKLDGEEASALWHILVNRNACDELALAAAETCLHPDHALPILGRAWMPFREKLPMSAGIGTAVIGERTRRAPAAPFRSTLNGHFAATQVPVFSSSRAPPGKRHFHDFLKTKSLFAVSDCRLGIQPACASRYNNMSPATRGETPR